MPHTVLSKAHNFKCLLFFKFVVDFCVFFLLLISFVVASSFYSCLRSRSNPFQRSPLPTFLWPVCLRSTWQKKNVQSEIPWHCAPCLTSRLTFPPLSLCVTYRIDLHLYIHIARCSMFNVVHKRIRDMLSMPNVQCHCRTKCLIFCFLLFIAVFIIRLDRWIVCLQISKTFHTYAILDHSVQYASAFIRSFYCDADENCVFSFFFLSSVSRTSVRLCSVCLLPIRILFPLVPWIKRHAAH